MSEQNPTTYDEFWPIYVRAHAKPLTRTFHAVGTSIGLVLGVTAIASRRPSLLVAGLAVGYGAAWFSHFFVEGNIPRTFTNPLWSLRGDMELLTRTLDGTMDAEVELHTRAAAAASDTAVDGGAVVNSPSPSGTLH